MDISRKDYNNYITRMARLSRCAADWMQAYIQRYGLQKRENIITITYALVTKYGEASSALACEMYEAIAEVEGVNIPYAEPAETGTIEETARAVNGALKTSMDGRLLPSVCDRLVKQAAADTMLKNARRDGAQWAWVPSGDSCAFCMVLASRGWQDAGRSQLRDGHARHIHANCDCQFMVRFKESTNVEGYHPDVLREIYDSADVTSSREKINSIRRMHYASRKEQINAQKRAAYAIDTKYKNLKRIPQIPASTIQEKIATGEYSLRYSQQQYDKHVEGTRDYERYRQSRLDKKKSPPSILEISKEEAESIIRTYSGTGIIKTDSNGNAMNIEQITCPKNIGKYWSHGEWHSTCKCAIHYGRHGAHIVPIRGRHYD